MVQYLYSGTVLFYSHYTEIRIHYNTLFDETNFYTSVHCTILSDSPIEARCWVIYIQTGPVIHSPVKRKKEHGLYSIYATHAVIGLQ